MSLRDRIKIPLTRRYVHNQTKFKEGISFSLAEVRHRAIEQSERFYLRELLTANRGRIKETAEAAGISTRQLHKLMKKYSITKEEFKTFPVLGFGKKNGQRFMRCWKSL